MEGQSISNIRTLGTMYDNDCIEVTARGRTYRMPCATVLQMVNEFVFKTYKKRVHTYLTVDWNATEERNARTT